MPKLPLRWVIPSVSSDSVQAIFAMPTDLPLTEDIEFIFYPANHSVIRAEYGYPCVPYEIHGVGREGFDSGFHPVRAITNDVSRLPFRYLLGYAECSP